MKEKILRYLNYYGEHLSRSVRNRLLGYWGAVPKGFYSKLLKQTTPDKDSHYKPCPNDSQERLYNVDFSAITPLSKELGPVEKGYDNLSEMRIFWDQQVEKYRKFVPFKSGVETILDIGCGNGSFAAACKELGLQVLNMDIDISYPYQQILSNRGLLTINWSARAKYPLVKNSFDATHTHDALFFFNSAEICFILNEWNRIVRPGGYFIITFFQCSGTVEEHQERQKSVQETAEKLNWQLLNEDIFVQESTGQQACYFIYQKPSSST